MSDGEERKKQSPLTWVLGGCGGLLLLGVCVSCVGPSVFGMAMAGFEGLGGLSSAPPVPSPMTAIPYDAATMTGGPVLPAPSGPLRPPSTLLEPSQDMTVRRVRFTISRVLGSTGLGIGNECVAAVERVMQGPADYRCRTDVVCNGITVYGGPGQGFFPCQLLMNDRRDVTGSDSATTEADGDGAFTIDTTINLVTVRDTTGPLGDFTLEGAVVAIE